MEEAACALQCVDGFQVGVVIAVISGSVISHAYRPLTAAELMTDWYFDQFAALSIKRAKCDGNWTSDIRDAEVGVDQIAYLS